MKQFFILLLVPFLLIAHPHEFGDVKIVVNMKKDKLKYIEVFWIFDEMASQMIVMNFDKNCDNSFDNSEVMTIEKESFKNLKEFDYYTNVEVNGNTIKIDEYDYFNAFFKKNKVIFKYKILKNTIKEPLKNLKMYINDPEYYTAFSLKSKNIKIKGCEDLNKVLIKVTEKEIKYYLCNELELKVNK